MTLITILSIIGIIILIGVLFTNLSPEFGGKISDEERAQFESLDNYEDGTFINRGNVKMSMSFSKGIGTMMKFLKSDPTREPDKPLPQQSLDSLQIVQRPDTVTQLTWFGHSSFLLETDGLKILIDPMLGAVPAPHPLLGKKRYNKSLPIAIEQLPQIDAIILSHDHYDHLDYGSIIKLKGITKEFYVPLGLGAHLEKWGISRSQIHELNWWDTIHHEHLNLVCAPAQHFSGRGLTDRGATLWASWIITSTKHNIYFSGDSGYGPHFKEIGDKFGPFDIAMMECGQYNEDWKEIHMMPEETAQAAVDVNTKIMIPIHWGAFTLSLHSWTDPVERVTAKAKELGMPVSTPKIGEPIIVGSEDYPAEEWWRF